MQGTQRRSDFRDVTDVISHFNKLPDLSELDAEDYCVEGGAADVVAKRLKDINQMRRLFSEIKAMQVRFRRSKEIEEGKANIPTELITLLPELAYARGRKLIDQDIYRLFTTIIGKDERTSKVNSKENLDQLVDFLSAIIAYHKMMKLQKTERREV